MMLGKVGSKRLSWTTSPLGREGESEVVIDQRKIWVKWIRDSQGIWIETEAGWEGYDISKTVNDEGRSQYILIKRNGNQSWSSRGFVKNGEANDSTGTQKSRKNQKLKSQMPGKIVRILVGSGDIVSKGQPLLVMEAMKMENEIKASADGKVVEVKVKEGQAVETGAELLILGAS